MKAGIFVNCPKNDLFLLLSKQGSEVDARLFGEQGLPARSRSVPCKHKRSLSLSHTHTHTHSHTLTHTHITHMCTFICTQTHAYTSTHIHTQSSPAPMRRSWRTCRGASCHWGWAWQPRRPVLPHHALRPQHPVPT